MAKTAATRLAEARDAYHALMTGEKTVELSYDGRVVKYEKTNIEGLRLYIRELEVEVGERVGARRAIGVRF